MEQNGTPGTEGTDPTWVGENHRRRQLKAKTRAGVIAKRAQRSRKLLELAALKAERSSEVYLRGQIKRLILETVARRAPIARKDIRKAVKLAMEARKLPFNVRRYAYYFRTLVDKKVILDWQKDEYWTTQALLEKVGPDGDARDRLNGLLS